MGTRNLGRYLALMLLVTGCATSREPARIPVAVPCPEPPYIEKTIPADVMFKSPLAEDGIVSINEEYVRNLLKTVQELYQENTLLREILKSYE